MADGDWELTGELNPDPGSMTFDPLEYYRKLGVSLGIMPQPAAPEEQVFNVNNPGMAQAPVPFPGDPPVMPQQPQGQASPNSGGGFMSHLKAPSDNMLGLASIVGGLGLGLARPSIGPQALQNFSAINLMQNREDQRKEAAQRIELAKEIELRRNYMEAAKAGIIMPGMPPNLVQEAQQRQAMRARVQNAFFEDGTPQEPQPQPMTVGQGQPIQAGNGGIPLPPYMPQPGQPQVPQQVAPPQAQNISAPPPAGDLSQYTAQSMFDPNATALELNPPEEPSQPSQGSVRMGASKPNNLQLSGPPKLVPPHTSKSLTYEGMTINKSTPTIDPAQFQTHQAINEVTHLWMTQPEAFRARPQLGLKKITDAYPLADPNKVKEGMTDAFVAFHTQNQQMINPTDHPLNHYIAGRQAALNELGPALFKESPQSFANSLNLPSAEQLQSAAALNPGPESDIRMGSLNKVQGENKAALTGAANAADYLTKHINPEQGAGIPGYRAGMTLAETAGQPALSTQSVQVLRNIRAALPKFDALEKINNEVASSQVWTDLAGQKFDVIKARLLSAGDPKFVAKVNAYEDYRQMVAISYARAHGDVGTQTDIDRLVNANVIPASGEFGPTAQAKWNMIRNDFNATLESMNPETVNQTIKKAPARPPDYKPQSTPNVLTPEMQQRSKEIDDEIKAYRGRKVK